MALTGAILGFGVALQPFLFVHSVHAQPAGPELFAKAPETPRELWDAVDYLVRTGQAAQAAPYLQQFLASNPPDELLVEIRDRYGAGTFLRLDDDPATKPFAPDVVSRITAAAQRLSRDPQRLDRFVKALPASAPERKYAVEQLRKAGPHAVPAIVRAISDPGYSSTQRAAIVDGLGQLDASAVPAITAVLDSPDIPIAADAAVALAKIGDTRALPYLTYPAAQTGNATLATPAQNAIAKLSKRAYQAQPISPFQSLLKEARNYLAGRDQLPDPYELWTWVNDAPAPQTVSRQQARALLASRFARQALALNPSDRQAQAILIASDLQTDVLTNGTDAALGLVPTPPESSAVLSQALSAGPGVLSEVLQIALEDNLPELAVAASTLLGKVNDRNALMSSAGSTHPLIKAIENPDRRVRLAAAQALVQLSPRSTFIGSSRVVPVLAQFVNSSGPPRAIVADGNPNQANTVASTLAALGFTTETTTEGIPAFQLATGSAATSVLFLDATGLQGRWSVSDLLINLAADSRTADLPVFLYGPLDLQDKIQERLRNHPKATFIVTPSEPQSFTPVFSRELDRLKADVPNAETSKRYAQRSAALLAQIAQEAGSPFGQALPSAEGILIRAMADDPTIAAPAAVALGEIPTAPAQRRLADVALDPSAPKEIQLPAASALTRSIQLFGPLLEDDQEKALISLLASETDPERRQALAAILGALRPSSAVTGQRLQRPNPSPSVVPAAPSSEPVQP